LYGVLAQIEAIGLGLLEVRRLPDGVLVRADRRSFVSAAGPDVTGRIAEHLAALRRAATLVAHPLALQDVFEVVAVEIRELLRADSVWIARFEPDGEPAVIADDGHQGDAGEPPPAIKAVFRTGRSAHFGHSSAAEPIVVGGRLWGAIAVRTSGERLPADVKVRLSDFASLAATAVAMAESHAELTVTRARIVATEDETRRRIQRDLHDGAQQSLVNVIITLKLARGALADGGPAPQLVDEALKNAEHALDELRKLSRGIHPRVLTAGGLVRALEALGDRSPIPMTLEVRTDARLSKDAEVTVYFAVAEALTNAAKHSHASAVRVAVETAGGSVRISIDDDGVGGADPARGSGLLGLKYRVEAIDGKLTVQSRPGHGTSLAIELPVDAAARRWTPRSSSAA
jgi:signal transduction histidine kinase